MANFLSKSFFAGFAMIMLAAAAFAQSTTTGGINGKVVDPQGAVVNGASVTVTNIGKNTSTTVTTENDGVFKVTNLEPGNYRVETTATGFGKHTAEVVVEVSVLTPLDVNLAVGGVGGEVTVTAEAPVVNTNDATNSTNINQTSINELPINGRRASNFVLATPGTAPDGNFGLISFRGISGLLNNSTVDGGDNNQAFFSEERGRTRINYAISLDAVREFSVNTSNYSAEFGRAAGGVVNTVTKSGTNEFHGSAFWYYRDNRWGARNPFSFQSVLTPSGPQTVAIKPVDERHQFGGSIGGPIAKDKLFFFFSYDQQKRDFPGVAAPASPDFFTNLTSRGSTGTLTQQQIDQGIAYLQNLTGEVPRKGDQILLLPKIDWVINEQHTFTAVYNRLRWDSPAGVQTQGVVTRGRTAFGSDFVDIDTINARLNSSFSATFLNEFRFQWSRDLERQIADTPDPSEPTTANGFPPTAAIAVANSGPGITIGKPNFLDRAAFPDEKRWQFADTITLIRGIHTVKFGGDFNHVSDKKDNLFRNAGEYTYNNLGAWLQDFHQQPGRCANTFNKCYASFAQGFGLTQIEFSTRDYNAFFQDDIRLDSNVTVNFGLRWEYQQLPDPQLPNPALPLSQSFPDDWNNFGPRIGFALSFGKDSRNIVRAGWGMYYGRITNSAISNAITNTGVAAGERQFFSSPSAITPVYPNVFTTLPAIGGVSDVIVFDADMENPLIHQMDLIYERQLGRNTVLSFTGMISVGRFLPTFVDTNLNPPSATTTFAVNGGPFGGTPLTFPRFTGPRPNTAFGRITEIRSTISSEYYGFVAALNRRLTDGLQFQTSYTFSKATDNGQGSQTFTSANWPLNPFDLSLEYGRSSFDVPHRFVASMVYAPDNLFGLGGSDGLGRAIFGGWTIAPIVGISSGFTYSPTVSGNAPSSTSTGIIGAGGFSRMPNLKPNSFRSPKTMNVDLRISRRIRFTETMNLEFLAEGFNIFNRANFTSVNTRMYSIVSNTPNSTPPCTSANPCLNFDTQFGVPTAAGNSILRERQIQIAARFHF